MTSRLFRASAALAVAFATSSATAFAQEPEPPSPSDMANARALGVEGVELADRGDCTTAIDRLWRAESLYHAPTILGRLGECQVSLGKLVAGTETLQRVLRDPIGPKSPPAFVAAHARAQKVLDAALPKLGKLLIHVDSAQTPGLVVKVDGDAIPLAGLDVDRLTDPGSHQVEASAPGFRTALQPVALPEGSAAQVALKLEPDAAAAPAVAPTAPPPAPAPAPAPAAAWNGGPAVPPANDEGAHPSKLGPYALLATGGVGIVLGSIFGGMALGKKSSLDSACHPKANCPAGSQSDIDGLNTDATIATVGFVVGGVAAAAGGAWLIIGSQSKPKTTASRVVVHPWVGPTSAGVTGAF
jgi:hypothetical protein